MWRVLGHIFDISQYEKVLMGAGTFECYLIVTWKKVKTLLTFNLGKGKFFILTQWLLPHSLFEWLNFVVLQKNIFLFL